MSRSLSEVLYRISLEAPGRWYLLISPGLEQAPPYLNIGTLLGFTTGYFEASGVHDGFFEWLHNKAKAFPGEGWARALLQRARGDHLAAITEFFALLHQFVLETRPEWFVRFNQQPQAGHFLAGPGDRLVDVRLAAHVEAVTGAALIAPPDVRVSSFEMNDVEYLSTYPSDVDSWWNGAGRRVAMLSSAERLKACRGSLEPLSEVLAQNEGAACVLDASADSVSVACAGGAGAVHVRESALISLTNSLSVTHWGLRKGDVVLMLSPALFERARALGVGPLPSTLATAEPAAWAKLAQTGRRLAVTVRLAS